MNLADGALVHLEMLVNAADYGRDHPAFCFRAISKVNLDHEKCSSWTATSLKIRQAVQLRVQREQYSPELSAKARTKKLWQSPSKSGCAPEVKTRLVAQQVAFQKQASGPVLLGFETTLHCKPRSREWPRARLCKSTKAVSRIRLQERSR